MIYETIPAKYFDHTALAKAIGEAFAIRDCAGYWANKAADELTDDRMSSGEAVEIGQFINWAKNIEFLVNHWIEGFNHIIDKMLVNQSENSARRDRPLSVFGVETEIELKIVDIDPLFIDKIDMAVNYIIQKTCDEIEKTDSRTHVFDSISGVYEELNQQVGILARNYKIQMGTIRSDLFSNGEVET